MGRPTKLTPAVAKVLCDATRRGHHLRHAAALAGVHHSVVYDWLARGEADDPPDADALHVDFALALRAAEAEAAGKALAEVRTGKSRTRQRGQAWWLERRFPELYGKRVQTQLSGPDGGPIQHAAAVAVELHWPDAPPVGPDSPARRDRGGDDRAGDDAGAAPGPARGGAPPREV